MFINKTNAGTNNICGGSIAALRKAAHLSQNKLATLLQLKGLSIDKNAIQRIEAGKRFVTDIELVYFSVVLSTPIVQLLNTEQLSINTGQREEDLLLSL